MIYMLCRNRVVDFIQWKSMSMIPKLSKLEKFRVLSIENFILLKTHEAIDEYI
jgi:hypothetical protein